MRIAGWRVDGYGVLADHRVDALPPGLSVVHGPNEAGKSTLLDFVRNVLFGFPDRRHSRPAREPLRGGRHGGALFLTDSAGLGWTVERHAGADLVVTGPHGATSGAPELARLLGGVDASVFASVFAFDLDELASLRSLERDEVRDLVFSAGVLGAGRSATRALRALADRQAALVRPRQQDAVANRLRRRIDQVDADLRTLKAGAAHYPERAEKCARLREGASDALRDADDIRRRRDDLVLLERCWPVWLALATADRDAGLTAPRTARDGAVLARAPDIERLARDRSGHVQRVSRARALRTRVERLEREIGEALGALGPGVDAERVRAVPVTDEVRAEAKRLATDEVGRRARTTSAREEIEAATGRLAAARRAHEAATAEGDPGARAGELERRVRTLRELGDLVGERDRILAERAASEQAWFRARVEAGGHHGGRGLQRAVAAALVLIAGATAAAAVPAHGRSTALAATLVAVAVALLALAGVVIAASRRRDAAAAADDRPPDPPAGSVDPERLGARIAELAGDLELAAAPSPAEVLAASRRADMSLATRRRLDELEGAIADAQAEVERVAARLDAEQRAAACDADEVATLAVSFGLPQGPLDAATLDRALATLGEVARMRRERDALRDEIAPLTREIGTHEAQVDALAAELESAGPADTAPLPDVERTALVDALAAELARVAARESRREALARDAAEARAELTRSRGSGDHADALRAELALGELATWATERGELDARLAAAVDRHEALLTSWRDAERDLEDLGRSDAIAALELERAGLAAELESSLEEYVVAGLARRLLDQTLRRYERERQPAVVARAAELFRTVTAGRYVELVARAETAGGRSQGISAIAESGAVVDAAALSRGTAEQLYLCLRLALASSFASGATALPVVLDDVLVNFDPARAAAVARAVAEVAATHQVIAFTCHPHIVELLRAAAPDARIVDLPRSG